MKSAAVVLFVLALIVASCSVLPFAFMLAGCTPLPRPAPKPVQADPSVCPDVCARARANHCPVGDPTPGGRTCEDVCASGLGSRLVNFDVDCMTHLVGCDDSQCARPVP